MLVGGSIPSAGAKFFINTGMKMPYIKKLSKPFRGLTVCIVDSEYIRNHLSIAFTNAGHHYSFKFIPKNEIWIDQDIEPKEFPIFVREMATERSQMAKGKAYDPAYEKGWKQAEKARKTLPDDHSVKIKKLMEYKGLKVFLVDGFEVRKKFNQDFVEGGHGRVYDYIPKNEIWLEQDPHIKDVLAVFLHEITEYNLMGNKHWSYIKAHNAANRNELKARKNKESLKQALIKEFKKLKNVKPKTLKEYQKIYQ